VSLTVRHWHTLFAISMYTTAVS